MNVYDLLNLGKIDKKEKIESAIEETKENLKDLTVERTCRIYTDELKQNLGKRHLLNRRIDTKDFDYSYSHEFILVPIDEESCYLIDMTYPQFFSSEFPELFEKGYQIVTEESFPDYMRIITNEEKQISLHQVVEEETVKIR